MRGFATERQSQTPFDLVINAGLTHCSEKYQVDIKMDQKGEGTTGESDENVA
jgi:hypothetical protein